MVRKNSLKNSAGMICVRAARDDAFKRFCLKTGRNDGSNRNYFSRE